MTSSCTNSTGKLLYRAHPGRPGCPPGLAPLGAELLVSDTLTPCPMGSLPSYVLRGVACSWPEHEMFEACARLPHSGEAGLLIGSATLPPFSGTYTKLLLVHGVPVIVDMGINFLPLAQREGKTAAIRYHPSQGPEVFSYALRVSAVVSLTSPAA